jgi:hypothetical protein
MDIVSNSDIDQIYAERRLAKLKELATLINQFLCVNPNYHKKLGLPDVANNGNIDESNDSDYLYFAIHARRMITNDMDLFVPQEIGYGYPYDKLFEQYCKIIINNGECFYCDKKNLIFLMLKYYEDLKECYIVFYTIPPKLNKLFDPLLNGSKRDLRVELLIELYKESSPDKIGDLLMDMINNNELTQLEIIRLLLLCNDRRLFDWKKTICDKYNL